MNIDNLKQIISKNLKQIISKNLYFRRKVNESLDNLRLRISRELSNMDIYKFKKGIRETFWMFYFLPSMACLIMGLILMVLHIDWYFLVPAVLLVGYSLQNLLFFMKYGKRKKVFHENNY